MNDNISLRDIEKTLSNLNGKNYFTQLVQLLREVTNADYTFIATIDPTANTAKSLAVQSRVGPENNFSYPLAGTPCSDLAHNQQFCIKQGIADRYPDDALLTEMGIVGYVGITLRNTSNHTVGILVALYKSTIHDEGIAENAFRFFSASALSEIERRNNENSLITKTNELEKKTSDLRIAHQIYDFMSDGVIITNPHNQIIYVNDALLTMSGYERDELVDKNPRVLNSGLLPKSFYQKMWREINTNSFWQGELINRKKSGDVYPIVTAISVLNSDEGPALNHIAVHRDITAEKQSRELIAFQASHDHLTGLTNRFRFHSDIDDKLKDRGDLGSGSIILIDIDNFKLINNSHGIEDGDLLLKQFALRLRSYCTENVRSISRLNGDQFGVLFTNNNPVSTATFSRNLLKKLNKPYKTSDGKEYFITLSLGISLFPHDAKESRELFTCAELALDHAKYSGKDTIAFYDEELKSRAKRIDLLRRRMAIAIANNSFDAYYQPIVHTKTKSLSHFEALARWHDEILGKVYPDEFIPISEEFGLIQGLGQCVTTKAIDGILSINENLTVPIGLSINRSAREFMSDDDHCANIVEMINHSDIDPSLVSIELTESMMINNESTAKLQLEHLRSLGFSISMDDFGTGFSSLGYLKKYPFDYIKIDRSFIADMTEQKESHILVKTIVDMAHNFGMQVIAEGVESPEQLEMLEILGCDYVQGYLFSPPMAEEEVLAYITDYHSEQISNDEKKYKCLNVVN